MYSRKFTDDHHYRHILISRIRKVWTDTNAPKPKKYSYLEWAYYLRLLGEDENNPRFHRKAPVQPTDPKKSHKDQLAQPKKVPENGGQTDVRMAEENRYGSGQDDEAKKWSWIGPRSPLMADKGESEWLLDKLFQRLEESLKDHWE